VGHIVVNIRKWVTKSLRPGDLTALSDISRRHWDDPKSERFDRLKQRGFVKKNAERPVITMLGRAALLIRRLTKR